MNLSGNNDGTKDDKESDNGDGKNNGGLKPKDPPITIKNSDSL